jgi:hypothetical protein
MNLLNFFSPTHVWWEHFPNPGYSHGQCWKNIYLMHEIACIWSTQYILPSVTDSLARWAYISWDQNCFYHLQKNMPVDLTLAIKSTTSHLVSLSSILVFLWYLYLRLPSGFHLKVSWLRFYMHLLYILFVCRTPSACHFNMGELAETTGKFKFICMKHTICKSTGKWGFLSGCD